MIGKNVISNRVAALAEVADILEDRKGKGEMGFEQQACLTYADRFKKVSKKKALDLVAELVKNPKIKEATAVKIADVMPKYESQLAAVLQKERCELSKAEMADILKQIAELAPKRPEPAKEPKEAKEEKESKEEEKEGKAAEKKEKEEEKEGKAAEKKEKEEEKEGKAEKKEEKEAKAEEKEGKAAEKKEKEEKA